MSQEEKLIHENLLTVVADLMKKFSVLDKEAKKLGVLVLCSLYLVFETSKIKTGHLRETCSGLD